MDFGIWNFDFFSLSFFFANGYPVTGSPQPSDTLQMFQEIVIVQKLSHVVTVEMDEFFDREPMGRTGLIVPVTDRDDEI